MSNFTALRSVQAALIHVDGRTDGYDKDERTYKLYIAVPVVSFVPSTIGKRVQNHLQISCS
jgi:hypothetical protein